MDMRLVALERHTFPDQEMQESRPEPKIHIGTIGE